MLLGNHDLETNLEKDPNIFIEDTGILEENCYIHPTNNSQILR